MSDGRGEQPTTTTTSGQDNSALIEQVANYAVATLSSAEPKKEKEKEPEKEKEREAEDPRWVEFRKVARAGGLTVEMFDRFLNDNNFTWYYVGGYAHFRWSERYSQELIDYGDYDVVVDTNQYARLELAMYGPGRKEEQWQIGGKLISVLPGEDLTDKQLVGTSWLVTPKKMARLYGAGGEEAEPKKAERLDLRKKATGTDSSSGLLASINKGGFQLKSPQEANRFRETTTPGFTAKASEREVDEEEKRKKEEKARTRGARKASLPALIEKYKLEYG